MLERLTDCLVAWGGSAFHVRPWVASGMVCGQWSIRFEMQNCKWQRVKGVKGEIEWEIFSRKLVTNFIFICTLHKVGVVTDASSGKPGLPSYCQCGWQTLALTVILLATLTVVGSPGLLVHSYYYLLLLLQLLW